ncbi:MAG: multiheme c-type cytochrome [Nitrospirota bacterium]
MKKAAAIILLLLLQAMPALAEDYADWAKEHPKASPIWVLPKATAPSNMDWTVPDMPGSHKAGQFYSPEVCSGCHADIFGQWKGSMMANAWIDPVFRAVYFEYVKKASSDHEKSEVAMCSRCHTPVGYLADDLDRYRADKKLPDIEAYGVQCDFCHSVSKSAGIGNGAFILSPGDATNAEPGTKYGPFKDAVSSFHSTEYSELHTRSELCGMCHDVNHAHNIMAIENTYSEWRTGPYNTGDPATTVTCQDCHMRQTPEYPSTGSTIRPNVPGYAAPEAMGGKQRPHIWQHYFVGGNLAVTALLGYHPQAKMAEDRLRHACTVEFIGEPKAQKGMLYRMPIKVTNSGAGHYLPTGLTFVREMWVDVTVVDSKKRVIFRSGDLDGKGNIKPGAVIYHTVLGKPSQKPEATSFLPEAGEILLDRRIRPKGYDIAEYSFVIPEDAAGPLSYHVEIRYRSAPQSVVNELLGKDAPTLPVFDMGEAEGEIGL